MVSNEDDEEALAMPDVRDTLKDAAYVTVGLGVLGFQRAQVQRVELTKRLSERGRAAQTQARGLANELDARIAPVRAQVEARVTAMQDRLPSPAREVVQQVRTAVHDTETHVRARLGLSL